MIDRLCRHSYQVTGAKKGASPILEPITGDWLGDGPFSSFVPPLRGPSRAWGELIGCLRDDEVPDGAGWLDVDGD